MIAGLDDRQIKHLSGTHEGKKHDKKICDEEETQFPAGSDLYRDSGFQGHDLLNVTIHQPKKKPRNGELAESDKENNRLISRIRVVIEDIISDLLLEKLRKRRDVFATIAEEIDELLANLGRAPTETTHIQKQKRKPKPPATTQPVPSEASHTTTLLHILSSPSVLIASSVITAIDRFFRRPKD